MSAYNFVRSGPMFTDVKLRCVLVRCGRKVCMTLVENRAVDLFFASD